MPRNSVDMELEQREKSVLRAMADGPGAVNPYYIREETNFGKGDVNTALNRLAQAGYVTKITRGLYEVTHSGERQADELRGATDS